MAEKTARCETLYRVGYFAPLPPLTRRRAHQHSRPGNLPGITWSVTTLHFSFDRTRLRVECSIRDQEVIIVSPEARGPHNPLHIFKVEIIW